MLGSETSRAQTHPFDSVPSQERRRPISSASQEAGWAGIPLVVTATQVDQRTVRIGISIHDGVYSVDTCINKVIAEDGEHLEDLIKKDANETIMLYSALHNAKFVGAGVTIALEKICPGICAYLWRELDNVGVKLRVQTEAISAFEDDGKVPVDVDEQADSAARKCAMYFGPTHNPDLAIAFRNRVGPDAEGAIRLVKGLGEYEATVHKGAWNTVLKYDSELKGYKNGQNQRDLQCPPTKIAFFSATPQGGGVALMRHALVRFCAELGLKLEWFVFISSIVHSYIPKPNPKAFRITKTNHNILQGVADPEARFDEDKQNLLNEWIGTKLTNAKRYWLTSGAPLAPGGADVVIIDDPQMPALIPIIKNDLVDRPGSPQEQVWRWMWDYIKQADVFISHPVDKFVPHDVPLAMVGLMPACTDWFWDLKFFHHDLRNSCNELGMNQLLYPAREYITQIARFDPGKGIPDVIESHRKLCTRVVKDTPQRHPPQLLLCGHGVTDDPDASIVFAETMELLAQPRYSAIAKDVVVMRIGPSDQILNALMTTAKLVVQLSLREGFEGKVSEALHHGKPVVATRAGGIPLQIQHGKSGFLVDVGDTDAVANHLFDLYTDDDLYAKMSDYAKASVSDEVVGTVDNAACWLYLAAKPARGQVFKPNGRWITDIAREEAGQRHELGEQILPHGGIDIKGEN
ncbi:hypothetical protein B9Z19DRAFT_1168589 [Tuber borchii]|uniref:Uncharacterized protein n=1 Tax=Tuber borchii TaxID=42251 RepID=A0A2T6ZAH7_TUBBO|nr:hypothetical protein B9Z19DRAFT_1168589 [Tuber borchii]